MTKKTTRADVGAFRVIKTFSRRTRGATRLFSRFGDALVCVRYRVEAGGQMRYTTVELIVDQAMIRSKSEDVVSIKVAPEDQSLPSRLLAEGAAWDPEAAVWRLPRGIVSALGLVNCIVRK